MKDFKEGDLVVFIGKGHDDKNSPIIYSVEIGKFKRYNADKTSAFVYYHSGDTAACTSVSDLEPLTNYWYIKTNLGNGDDYV